MYTQTPTVIAAAFLFLLSLSQEGRSQLRRRPYRPIGRWRVRTTTTTTTEAPLTNKEPEFYSLNELAARISQEDNPDCTAERLAKAEQCTLDAAFIGLPDFVPPSNGLEMREFCR